MDEQHISKSWERFVQLVNTKSEITGEIIGHFKHVFNLSPFIELKIYTWYAMDTERYETLVSDDRYTPIGLVVEAYETRAQAQEGHKKWIQLLLSSPPAELYDITTSEFKYKLTYNASQSYN